MKPNAKRGMGWMWIALLTTLSLSACSKGCGCDTPSAVAPASPNKAEGPRSSAPQPAAEAPGAPGEQAASVPKLEIGSIPDVVGKVNGVEIGKEAVLARLKLRNPNYEKLDKDQLSNVLKSVIDQEITDQVLKTNMDKHGLALDETVIKEKVEKGLDIFGGDSEEALRNMGDRAGMLRGVMEEGTRSNAMLEKLYEDQVLRNITVSRAEIEDYYDKNMSRFNVPRKISTYAVGITYTTADKNDKRAVADTALKRILSGEDFSAVAREMSTDEGSRQIGGFIDKMPVPEKVEPTGDPFYDWLYSSKAGEVSPVIDYPASSSWVILKNNGFVDGRKIPLAEVEEEIEFILRSGKADMTMEEFGSTIWDNAQIERVIE